MGLGGHSHVLWCFLAPQRPHSITLSHETLLEIPEEMQHFSTSFTLPLTITPLLQCGGSAPWAGWPAGESPRQGEGGLQERGERATGVLGLAPVGDHPASPLVEGHDPCSVQPPPQRRLQHHVMVGIKHQQLLLQLIVVVRELLVVGGDEPIGTDLQGGRWDRQTRDRVKAPLQVVHALRPPPPGT